MQHPLYIPPFFSVNPSSDSMESFKLFLLLATIMASSIIALTSPTQAETFLDGDESSDIPRQESSLRGPNRFLAQKTTMTCDKYPRVCREKGSPGPDCCKKKCVDVMTDRLNCGKCGNECKYAEICCEGGCVNPMSNNKHCGGCNVKCNKCVYGMCNYA